MSTATNKTRTPPAAVVPDWIKDEWETAALRVQGPIVARRLWDRVLSAEDRRRLGGDLEAASARHGGAVGMWRHLRGASIARATVAVAVRIGAFDADAGRDLLRSLGEEPDDPADMVDTAVASGGLVLSEAPRRAYWKGERVCIDWSRHTKLWELLLELARASKAGEVVDAAVLRETDRKDKEFLKKWKNRLVKVAGFPSSLEELVVVAGRGSYKLDLPSDQIRVFERGLGDPVKEWLP